MMTKVKAPDYAKTNHRCRGGVGPDGLNAGLSVFA
jgi:hypothetical protein